MKLQYLGTAAAEGIPAIFCDCETCKMARAMGGKNIRTRSQAIIDDKLLIDFPADTYMHFLMHGMPLSKVKNCLITHSHMDHLYADEISMRKNGFAHLDERTPLTFYSDVSGYNMLSDIKTNKNISDEDIMVEKIPLFSPFEVDGYTVTALRAAHGEASTPVVYLIEKDGKTLFYSNDTSEYPEESMEYLKTLKKPCDLISLDCTEANGSATYVGHLTLNRCIDLRKTLTEIGAADENTLFILNHFSHNGKDVLYDDFVRIAAEHNFDVSYDGMIINI